MERILSQPSCRRLNRWRLERECAGTITILNSWRAVFLIPIYLEPSSRYWSHDSLTDWLTHSSIAWMKKTHPSKNWKRKLKKFLTFFHGSIKNLKTRMMIPTNNHYRWKILPIPFHQTMSGKGLFFCVCFIMSYIRFLPSRRSKYDRRQLCPFFLLAYFFIAHKTHIFKILI